MNSKAISRVSRRIFESVLPPNWVLRPQEDQEDYGVDGEIEITTPEDKATGFIFKIQLKGTERAQFDENGGLVFSAASVERFGYYTDQLLTPIVFVVCDVQSGACYWLQVQGNRAIAQSLGEARARGQSTFTVRLPARNRWTSDEESQAHLIEAIHGSNDSITLRRMRAVSEYAVRAAMPNANAAADMESRFRLLAGIAVDTKIKALLQSGEVQAALDEAERVFEDDRELPAVRISAGSSFIQAMGEVMAEEFGSVRHLKMAGFKLGVSGGMIRIARQRDCQKYYRVYALGFARAARLAIAAESTKAAVISELTQKAHGDHSALSFVELQRLEASSRVARDFFALQRIVLRAFDAQDESLFVVPYIWSVWSEALTPFLWAMSRTGKEELASAYHSEMDRIFRGCVTVITFLKNEEEAKDILHAIAIRFASMSLLATSGSAQRRFEELKEALGGRMQVPYVARVFDEVVSFISKVEAEANEAPLWTAEGAREHYKQLAFGLGINVDDPNDQFAEAVRIGLEDLDPTRVSNQCEFIHIAPAFAGLPARMLGLWAAGGKRIVCLKHGHSMEGLKLDDVYRFFSTRMPWDEAGVRCENCPDKSPMPEDWKWSEEWEHAQAVKYADLNGRKEAQ